MAQITIKTIGGEMLDSIAHIHYKGQAGGTEAILKANPGLARYGPVLPADIEILLPELPKNEPTQVKLWD